MAAVASSTQEILGRVNGEVMENAGLVSEHLLTGLFRALFRVERATEVAEPQVFSLDDDPALILDKRMTPAHWRHLPMYVANGEILAKRFQQYMEFEFVFVADLTPSMGYRWRDLYLGAPGLSDNADYLGPETLESGSYSSTKLYILKYLLYAYLFSAARFGFQCRAMFFTPDDVVHLRGESADFAFQALNYVDEHFLSDENLGAWEARDALPSPYHRVFQELLDYRQEAVMVLATDFMDLVHGRIAEEEIDPYLAELKYQHRFAIMQVNDPHEVNTLDNKDDLPTSTRWAFPRDVERPDEGGLGQQKYYRPPARNRAFVESARRWLGPDDVLAGGVAEMAARRAIKLQKFVYGRGESGENLIEQRLQEISRWLEES